MNWVEQYRAVLNELSAEQQLVLQDLHVSYNEARPPLRVLATAGAGKTRTTVAGVAYLINSQKANPADLVLSTFTKKAQLEISERLTTILPPAALATLRVGTYHGLAYRVVAAAARARNQAMIRAHGWSFGLNLDSNPRKRAAELSRWAPKSLNEDAVKAMKFMDLADIWEAIASRGEDIPTLRGAQSVREKLGSTRDPKDLARDVEVLRSYAVTTPEEAIARQIVDVENDEVKQTLHAWRLYNQVKKNLVAWDFADLLQAYYELVQAGGDRARLFLVDEAQDNTYIQMAIARQVVANTAIGRSVYIGDVRQCIPEGQLVATPSGQVAIENLRVGAEVYSSFGGTLAPARVTQISQTTKFEAFEYTTETGSTFRATAEHVLFAALGKPTGYYVYLMWRKGYGYRVGASQATGDKGLKHIIVRTQQEGGERLWILHCVDTAAEAHLLEHTVAYRYQVPMAPFKPRDGTMFVDDDAAAAFFNEFQSNGRRVLAEYHQDFERPAYVAKSSSRGRVAVNVNIATSKGYSEVAVESQNVPAAVKAQFGFTASKNACWRMRKYPRLAVDAVALGATIRDAMPDDAYVVEVLSLRDTDRRVFGVCAAGVFPGMYVPEADAHGEVHLRLIVSRRVVPASRCFDLQVDASVNFVVGNVVVHNSIYGFRGARPEILGEADTTEGATTLELTTNYRSGRKIVEAGNAIAKGQPWAVGSPAVPGRTDDGVVRIIRAESPVARARQTASEVAERIRGGAQPKDHAVLARTRAAMAPYEVMFLIHNVPAVVQGGSPFFKNKAVDAVMQYIRLGTGTAPPQVLLEDFGRALRKLRIFAKKDVVHQVWSTSGALRQPTKAAELLGGWYDDEVSSKRRVLLWGRDQEKKEAAFEELLGGLEDVARGGTPTDVVEAVIRRLGRLGIIAIPDEQREDDDENEDEEKPTGEGDTDREMVGALAEIAASMSLDELVQISLRAGELGRLVGEGDSTRQEVNEADEASGNKVVVGTVHSAKGLEWPVVYLLSGVDELPHKGEDTPEERRLFYVGVTRARDVLVLASAGEESAYVQLVRADEEERAAAAEASA